MLPAHDTLNNNNNNNKKQPTLNPPIPLSPASSIKTTTNSISNNTKKTEPPITTTATTSNNNHNHQPINRKPIVATSCIVTCNNKTISSTIDNEKKLKDVVEKIKFKLNNNIITTSTNANNNTIISNNMTASSNNSNNHSINTQPKIQLKSHAIPKISNSFPQSASSHVNPVVTNTTTRKISFINEDINNPVKIEPTTASLLDESLNNKQQKPLQHNNYLNEQNQSVDPNLALKIKINMKVEPVHHPSPQTHEIPAVNAAKKQKPQTNTNSTQPSNKGSTNECYFLNIQIIHFY